MTGRPGKKPGPLRVAGDPETPGGFRGYLVEFIAWTAARQYSAMTVKARRIEVGYFIDWCEERSIRRPDEVTRGILERYRQHIFQYRRKTDGAPLSHQTQGKRLISVRAFFQWMARQHHLLYNPASELELPRQQQRLPRHILSVAEVEQVLNACLHGDDTTDPLGLRDRAMLEMLYSTGMRRAEITALRVDDVDFNRGTVFVRLGKGAKDRVVPIGERACRWIERYLFKVRPELVDVDDDGALFLAKHGAGMQAKQLSVIVRGAIAAANLERFQDTHPNAACHLLRHACATHMLENGADSHVAVALLARMFAIPRKALLDGLELDDDRQATHRRMHHNLRFCTDCMEMAYHSVMHQRVGASRCPHHGVMLEDVCRGCGAAAPYQLNARLLGSPFRCAECRRPYGGWRAKLAPQAAPLELRRAITRARCNA